MKTFKELNQWIEQLADDEETELDDKKSYPGKGWILGTEDEPPKPKDKDDDAKAFASIRKWQEKK